MRTSLSVFFLLFITLSSLPAQQLASLGRLLNSKYPSISASDQKLVLVSFTDKGSTQRFKSINAKSLLSDRAINRRLKVRTSAALIDDQDFPLEQSYVRSVANNVTVLRHELKWFNAVSVIATKSQIEKLRSLPFVKEIELIGRWRVNRTIEMEMPVREVAKEQSATQTTALNYGTSFMQLNQIKVPAVHNRGIYGQGVVVGVFDNGFRLLTHEAFASMNIIATYDFVDHKVSVIPNNTSTAFGSHGVNTLSTIGGFKSGQLIGPAFKSSFILARTENDSSETPVEEDNWASAIQWADSIGVDVTSTSLGYLDFDPTGAGGPDLTWQDMNGTTALITRAADRASELGIVVVNSAGNEGPNALHNTLIAPADGFNVITAGAVDSFGVAASFTSVGPTTDVPARIKPDVTAMGVAVKVASSTVTTGYGRANGTSFSCPLSAGVAALVLCANPTLTPTQVRQAMRQTANNTASPNNTYGWGILNADSAIRYYGILPFARINGSVYLDRNGDGKKEPGETGIAGIKIRLTGGVTDSTSTNSLGDYTFDSLGVGIYSVNEDIPSGWLQSYPLGGTYSVSVDSANANASHKDFGNYQVAAVHGAAFEDLNADGIKDPLEPPLSNWRIKLVGNTTLASTTDGSGNFSFLNVPPGNYALSESLKTNWLQSLPDSNYKLNLLSGLDTSGLDFGNFRLGSIQGMKFNDLDSNGFKDAGDSGLAQWTIKLNGYSAATTVTDTGGHYSFVNLHPGTYTVSELARPAWVETYPPGGSYSVTIRSGLDTTALNFGNNFAPNTTFSVLAGWNLLSLPVESGNRTTFELYPTASSEAYKFAGGYKRIDTIPNSIGYWLRLDSARSIPMSGEVRLADTIPLNPGWHMIGTLTLPVQIGNIQQIPDTLITTPYYYFDGGYQQAVGTLDPHRGYWVRTKTSGRLILAATTSKRSSGPPQPSRISFSRLNILTVTDRAGSVQRLFFGNFETGNQNLQAFELPPLPPFGIFDVRFSSGMMVERTPFMNNDASFTIRGAAYPITLSWKLNEEDNPYILSTGNGNSLHEELELQSSGTISIESPAATEFHLQQKSLLTAEQLSPKEFELGTNYPNPFNPSTTISYALPTETLVKIQIYNLIGQQIAELVNKTQAAGRYKIVWDAASLGKTELPGGIYFYRLDAFPTNGSKPFTQMKKMTLLK